MNINNPASKSRGGRDGLETFGQVSHGRLGVVLRVWSLKCYSLFPRISAFTDLFLFCVDSLSFVCSLANYFLIVCLSIPAQFRVTSICLELRVTSGLYFCTSLKPYGEHCHVLDFFRLPFLGVAPSAASDDSVGTDNTSF